MLNINEGAMRTRDFNIAAYTPPFAFDLDREVAAFYRDHPEQKRKIYFIDAATMPGAICRGDETDEDEVAALLGRNGGVLKNNIEAQEAGCLAQIYPDNGYGCVFINTAVLGQSALLGNDIPASVSEVFSFDHETGHLLCKEGYGPHNFNECVADAYAVLRHFQRFGMEDTSAIKNLLAMRTLEMIFGQDGSHFTAPVVAKILADAQKTDFSGLSPAATAALAHRYAAENLVDPAMTRHLIQDFTLLGQESGRLMKGDFTPVRLMAEMVLATNDRSLFTWGAMAVHSLLDGNTRIRGELPPKPAGPEWTTLRQRLDDRAARFGQPQRQKLIIVSDMKL
jgi:hypothetical protein